MDWSHHTQELPSKICYWRKDMVEDNRWWKDQEEDVRSFWMTFSKTEDTENWKLDCNLSRTGFGRDHGPVERMNEWNE